LITDHSQQLTTSRWEQAVNRALERVNRLSLEDKLAIALHEFSEVTVDDFVPFDYCDGPNGVRGHQGATAFPSTLALAASFDRDLAHRYGVALGREVLTAEQLLGVGRDAINTGILHWRDLQCQKRRFSKRQGSFAVVRDLSS
jgi:hypothetical protein